MQNGSSVEQTTTTYTYDNNDRMTQTSVAGKTSSATVTQYTYDNNGNMLSKSGKGPKETYTYDVRNREITASVNGYSLTYKYRPDGLRYMKTYSKTTVYHIWDNTQMIMEMDGSGVVTATYLRGTYLYAAKTRDSNSGTASSYKYYMYNGHGDTVQLLSTTGAILWKYDYDAFGNLSADQDAKDTNPFLYCAEYYDRESKTVYLRARYYDPAIGRFTSQDSWEYADTNDPLSLNLYTYCKDSPVILSDASGNFPVLILLGGALLVYGMVTYYTSGQATYNYNTMVANPNWYTIGNWATVGTFDMIKGTFRPEQPLSLQHWMDSFGTASLILTFMKMAANANVAAYNPNPGISIAGAGSTGRTVPFNLKEQLAMKQVMSNPLNGAVNLSQTTKPVVMSDPRWLARDGWIKMSQNVNGVEIHFVYNTITKLFDDFKFVGGK